jgi:hypothetical protein
MALADGELDGAEREHAEKLVAEDDDARRIVEEMRGAAATSWLGPAMMARAAGADGVAASVMAKVDAGGVGSRLDRRVARRSPRLSLVVAAATAGLALAAGVAAYVHSGAARPGERAPVASVRTPPVDFQAPSAIAQQAGSIDGVEVNEIDAPARGVSVFEIPAAAAAAVASPSRASSVVVWVDEDPPEPK